MRILIMEGKIYACIHAWIERTNEKSIPVEIATEREVPINEPFGDGIVVSYG